MARRMNKVLEGIINKRQSAFFNGRHLLHSVLVAMGDGERAWNIGNGFGRKKEKGMAFFQSYLDYKAQNAQMSNALRNGNVTHTL